MVDIKPDRTNWKQFCQEARLTDEEHVEWKEMCAVIVENDDLFTFVEERTKAEWKEALSGNKPAGDWSDLVKRTDAHRRLQRVEIKAWREWKENES